MHLPHVGAIVAYTYDLQQADGKKAGNLYFELNAQLRKRGVEDRATTMKVWGPFIYYFMNALSTLPDVETDAYRGYPDKDKTTAEYRQGRQI
jgi:hypothetical protein